MLFTLLKQHIPFLIFIVEPMMPYTDALDALFKTAYMHLIANSPIISKAAKFWCLVVPNLVQYSLVNS